MNFNPNLPQINQRQFTEMASRLPDQVLVQLVQQARAQGMSEADISAGLNFIQQWRCYGTIKWQRFCNSRSHINC